MAKILVLRSKSDFLSFGVGTKTREGGSFFIMTPLGFFVLMISTDSSLGGKASSCSTPLSGSLWVLIINSKYFTLFK